MTAKEKALELANKFVTKSIFDMTGEELKEERIKAKKNALICTGEVIIELCHEREYKDSIAQNKLLKFWLEVKVELNAL